MMKRAKFISSLLILTFLLSVAMAPVASAASVPAGSGTVDYDVFSYSSAAGYPGTEFIPAFEGKMMASAEKTKTRTGAVAAVVSAADYDTFSYKSPGADPGTEFVPAFEGKAINGVDKTKTRAVQPGKNGVSVKGQKPASPTGLAVTKTTNSSITFKWGKVSGAKSYKVYFSTSKNGKYKSKGTTKSTSFTVKGLRKNKTYYLKVSAANSAGAGVKSEAVSGKATVKPGVPTGFRSTPVDASTILLEWNKAANAKEYGIYIAEDEPEDFEYFSKTTKLKMGITDMDYDTDYYIGIIAFNKSGYTAGPYIKTITKRYPAPTGLTATLVQGNKVQLQWNAVPGAPGYTIYAANDGDTEYDYDGESSTTSYTTDALTENCNYYFVVCSDFNGDESDISNEAAIKTGYQVPDKPSFYSSSVNYLDYVLLSWGYVSKATKYRIYVSTTADGQYTPLSDEPTSTYYYYKALIPNTDYYFKVSAVNNTAEGEQSDFIKASVDGTPTISSCNYYSSLKEISIYWSTVFGATGYNIYYSVVTGGPYTYLGTRTSTSFTLTGAVPNTDYYFVVTAIKDTYESKPSREKWIRTSS